MSNNAKVEKKVDNKVEQTSANIRNHSKVILKKDSDFAIVESYKSARSTR